MAQPGQQLPKAEGWDLGASPWEGGRAGPGSPGPSHLQPGAASGTGTALGIGYLPGDGDGLRSRLSRARGWAGQGWAVVSWRPALLWGLMPPGDWHGVLGCRQWGEPQRATEGQSGLVMPSEPWSWVKTALCIFRLVRKTSKIRSLLIP